MNNLYDIYQTENFIVDKVRNGYVTPDDFSKSIAIAQTSVYQKYYNEYILGSELAMMALRPFFKNQVITSDINGVVTYPTDFAYLQNAYTYRNNEAFTVSEILHDELSYYTKSRINPLSSTNVKLIQGVGGCQLYPKRKIEVDYHYVKKPTQPYLYCVDNGVDITPIVGSGFIINVATIGGSGEIGTISYTSPMGENMIDGSYVEVPIVGGTGSGGTVSFTVSNGFITTVSIVNAGSGYLVGDTLTINYSVELEFDKQFWVEIMNESLKYIGLNLSNQELLQVMAQQK